MRGLSVLLLIACLIGLPACNRDTGPDARVDRVAKGRPSSSLRGAGPATACVGSTAPWGPQLQISPALVQWPEPGSSACRLRRFCANPSWTLMPSSSPSTGTQEMPAGLVTGEDLEELIAFLLTQR